MNTTLSDLSPKQRFPQGFHEKKTIIIKLIIVDAQGTLERGKRVLTSAFFFSLLSLLKPKEASACEKRAN